MHTSEIAIPLDNKITLMGNLNFPDEPQALVIFSHGSGSSRFSTRNRYVAEFLNANGFATLLNDLLTEDEDRTYANRFEIDLLTDRLVRVTNYVMQKSQFKNIPVGYFGASTGAASALQAAAQLPGTIQAVVSRGGRPDLAMRTLPSVKAPTLLIIGSLDADVIMLNKDAFARLKCEKDLRIVKGASHLFEEPGKLDEVADLAAGWFTKHLIYAIK